MREGKNMTNGCFWLCVLVLSVKLASLLTYAHPHTNTHPKRNHSVLVKGGNWEGKRGEKEMKVGVLILGGFDSNSSLSFEQYMCVWNG